MAIDGYVLRSKDVAHILDISPDDAVELAQREKLRAKKEGRIWRYSIADVKAYKGKQERERLTRTLSRIKQLNKQENRP
jgi:hypothetical protein